MVQAALSDPSLKLWHLWTKLYDTDAIKKMRVEWPRGPVHHLDRRILSGNWASGLGAAGRFIGMTLFPKEVAAVPRQD